MASAEICRVPSIPSSTSAASSSKSSGKDDDDNDKKKKKQKNKAYSTYCYFFGSRAL